MTKTLADMTPEEQQACVGMWCDNLVSTAQEPAAVVLACVQGDLCWILHTTLHGEWSCFSLDSVAPRADLPRAWNPDGTPPKGEWEEGWCYTGGTPTGDYACLIETQDGTAYTSEETPTGDIRRFITEWENTND